MRSVAFLRPLEEASVAQALERCELLEQQARADLGDSENATLRRRAALRYAGQGFELAIELPQNGSSHTDRLQDIRAAFEREYRRTYGHELEGNRIEFVALRVFAAVPPRGAQTVTRSRSTPHRAPREASRMAYFGARHGLLDTPVIGREALDATPRPGPLIIEEYEGTTVVPPRATALRDALGNIVVALAGDHVHAA
jgi:N-methylhydantoinase A